MALGPRRHQHLTPAVGTGRAAVDRQPQRRLDAVGRQPGDRARRAVDDDRRSADHRRVDPVAGRRHGYRCSRRPRADRDDRAGAGHRHPEGPVHGLGDRAEARREGDRRAQLGQRARVEAGHEPAGRVDGVGVAARGADRRAPRVRHGGDDLQQRRVDPQHGPRRGVDDDDRRARRHGPQACGRVVRASRATDGTGRAGRAGRPRPGRPGHGRGRRRLRVRGRRLRRGRGGTRRLGGAGRRRCGEVGEHGQLVPGRAGKGDGRVRDPGRAVDMEQQAELLADQPAPAVTQVERHRPGAAPEDGGRDDGGQRERRDDRGDLPGTSRPRWDAPRLTRPGRLGGLIGPARPAWRAWRAGGGAVRRAAGVALPGRAWRQGAAQADPGGRRSVRACARHGTSDVGMYRWVAPRSSPYARGYPYFVLKSSTTTRSTTPGRANATNSTGSPSYVSEPLRTVGTRARTPNAVPGGSPRRPRAGRAGSSPSDGAARPHRGWVWSLQNLQHARTPGQLARPGRPGRPPGRARTPAGPRASGDP